MSAKRVFGCSVALSAAFLTAPSAAQDEGPGGRNPKARISANYVGGPYTQTLRASFRADKRAYAMVGHLTGDGRIEVLFPEDPRDSERIEAKKSYSTGPIDARNDGEAARFNFTSRAYRSASARLDSYDGNGNGFVFIIASSRPLDFDPITDEDGGWAEYRIEDYHRLSDPRSAVGDLARFVAGGSSYSIDYAGSFTTSPAFHYTSFGYGPMSCGSSLFGHTFGGYSHFGWSNWNGYHYGITGFFSPLHPVFYVGSYYEPHGTCYRNWRHYAVGRGWRHYRYSFGYTQPVTLRRFASQPFFDGASAAPAVARSEPIEVRPVKTGRIVEESRRSRVRELTSRLAARERPDVYRRPTFDRGLQTRIAQEPRAPRAPRMGTAERQAMRGRLPESSRPAARPGASGPSGSRIGAVPRGRERP